MTLDRVFIRHITVLATRKIVAVTLNLPSDQGREPEQLDLWVMAERGPPELAQGSRVTGP